MLQSVQESRSGRISTKVTFPKMQNMSDTGSIIKTVI